MQIWPVTMKVTTQTEPWTHKCILKRKLGCLLPLQRKWAFPCGVDLCTCHFNALSHLRYFHSKILTIEPSGHSGVFILKRQEGDLVVRGQPVNERPREWGTEKNTRKGWSQGYRFIFKTYLKGLLLHEWSCSVSTSGLWISDQKEDAGLH